MPRGPRGEKRPADVIGAEALPLFVETRCGGTCSARPYSDCVWCPIAASGGILTPEQATELASTKWGENRELRGALLDQCKGVVGVNGHRGRHGDASGGDDRSSCQGGLGED